MATLLYGGILWIGDSGLPREHEMVSKIPLRGGGGALDTFVTSIIPHTLCLWRQKFVNQILSRSISPPAAGANVDVRAIIYYRDPVDLTVLNFEYPAPIAADIETTSVGKRVKQSVVTSIVGYISTMTGVSYQPLYGVYVERV